MLISSQLYYSPRDMQIQPLAKAVGTSFRPLSGYYMMARLLCNRLDFLSLTFGKKKGGVEGRFDRLLEEKRTKPMATDEK